MIIKGESDLRKVIEKIDSEDLASIKNSLTEIIQIINNPMSTARDLTQTIELDSALTARILRVANSAYYGSLNRIANIRQAIVRIGFDLIKELALSQTVVQLFKKKKDVDFSPISLWHHSLAVAHCAKAIYRKEYKTPGSDVFTAGILHDIGMIIENQFLTEQFDNVLEMKKMMKDNIVNAEISEMNLAHTDIATALFQHWNLPKKLVVAVGNHHNPSKVEKDDYRLTGTLYLADYIVQRKEIGFSDTPFRNKNLFRKTLQNLNIIEMGLEIIVEEVEQKLLEMKKKGWFDE